MTIQKVSAIYFSPTGTTKSVLKHILTEFDTEQDVIDLTPHENRNNSYLFNDNDNLVNEIAFGRPNTQDLIAVYSFTKRVQEKISLLNHFENISLKGEILNTPRDM